MLLLRSLIYEIIHSQYGMLIPQYLVCGMLQPMNWENEARRIVRAELVRRGITYKGLAARLVAIGVNETERSIANKMSRGTFSFVFVLQCLQAIGAKSMSVEIAVGKSMGKRKASTDSAGSDG